MTELENISGAQLGIWLACAWVLLSLYNAGSDAWERFSGRGSSKLPDPIHISEATRYATEQDIQRMEKRVQHLEEAQTAQLLKMERDKTEIMEAAAKGRNQINEQISLLAATCNRTAGVVQEMGAQIAMLVQHSLRGKKGDQ